MRGAANRAPRRPWAARIRSQHSRTAPLPPGSQPPPAQSPEPEAAGALPAVPEVLPDPFEHDVSPWLLRRLHLAIELAERVRGNAQDVLAALASAPADPGKPLLPQLR